MMQRFLFDHKDFKKNEDSGIEQERKKTQFDARLV